MMTQQRNKKADGRTTLVRVVCIVLAVLMVGGTLSTLILTNLQPII